ncbi:hypothetical protein LOTGIDRAFT_173315 [Lottia gigantea]|uniref:TNFR-Cys domain-containing protein n=1 Tax=Lottia gigantea TaxID=225164 RepID=V4CE97_LOTGI|nr:hypothetical protein LOTGIDRAFT_173315 [Lottia gigantea]ESP00290.1 hypothetical protein LOTGIDRAFT_173315 [Lottia gigantea]
MVRQVTTIVKDGSRIQERESREIMDNYNFRMITTQNDTKEEENKTTKTFLNIKHSTTSSCNHGSSLINKCSLASNQGSSSSNQGPASINHVSSSSFHGSSSGIQGSSSGNQGSSHGRRCIIVLLTTFLIGLVCATTSLNFTSQHVQLHIGLPHNLIRKVRMYSEDPDIRKLKLNKTVLSLVSRLQLYDKKDCKEDLSVCETYAVCNGNGDSNGNSNGYSNGNGQSSVACRCKRGYYYNDNTCSECSKSCPDGYYMTSSCTATTDSVCKKCTSCQRSQYEAAVCSTTKDTVCVDVSFPVGFVPPNSTTSSDGTNISMTSSSNVFIERLKDMKELETTMYITNNQQSLDFVWKRESGLEIKISVSGVYLVPEYVDLDHEDDGLYFLHFDKNVSEEMKKKYSHVAEYYCRHPIPDYYSIHFDIIKNRISQAEEVACNSKDRAKIRCPSNYQDGQVYLKRHINEICTKYQTNRRKKLVQLHDVNANNIICDEENDILTEVFGKTMPEPERMSFPSAECRQYGNECHKCLDKNICTNKTYGEECCSIKCYGNSNCLQYHRSTCPQPQVECAKGNINQFTLTPFYEKISERFMCHLKYKKPKYLYNVSYSIQIPDYKYVLPEQNFSFTTNSLQSHQTQKHKIDFLNIMHDTRYKLEEEVIVIGKHEDYNEQMGEFQFHPLKDQDEFNTGRGFKTKQDTFFRYSTLVQFYRPFGYSSSTWYKDGCLKNLSKVFPNQTQYKSTSIPVTTKVLNTKKEMQYQMYRSKDSPIVKLTIDERESILSYFQSSGTPTVVRSTTLQGAVTWNTPMQYWTIRISGSLYSCPGILIIELFDKLLVNSFGVFDVYVHCGGEFWINFNVDSEKSDLPDVFIVHINDSVATHQLVLSSIISPRSVSVADKMKTSLAVREQIMTESPPWVTILIFIVMTIVLLWVMFIFYMCFTVRAPHNYERTDKQAEMTVLNPEEAEKMFQSEIQPKRKRMSVCVMYLFVILYIVYCVFLTFSVSFGILFAYQKSVLPDLTQLNDFSDRLEKRVNLTLQDLKLTEIKEMNDIHKQYKSRERACKHHLHQTAKSSVHGYAQVTHKYLEAIYVQNGSLQHHVEKYFEIENHMVDEILNGYVKILNKTMRQDLKHFLSMYKYFLISVIDNRWLDFPKDIFLGDGDKMKLGKEMTENQIKKFVSWLQIDKAESLMSVTDHVTARILEMAPISEDYQPEDFLEPYLPKHSHKIPTYSMKSQNFLYQVINENNTHFKRHGIHFDSGSSNTTSDKDLESSDYNIVMYLFICLFIILDIILWCYRLSWLWKQIKMSKVGYEVKIPTDESSRKIHILLTGQHPPSTVDIEIENAFKYYKENAAKDLASDNEFGMSFIQNYPKCKEDILRDIWAYKKSQSSASVPKANDFCLSECMTIIHWIHRSVLSRLTWRSALSIGALVLVCCLIYAVDNWFNQANIEVLVGADVVVTELQWQTVMINRHLAETVDKLNLLLLNMKETVDGDINYVNQLLADTFHKQTRYILDILLSVCKNSGINDCNIDINMLLQSAPPPPISSCNFLPLQQHVIDDVDTAQITALVIEELSPLLKTVRGLVFCILTYLIFVLCFILLCNAGIRLARYYLLIMGKFPILQIYQISDSLATYADAAVDDHQHIYRSASLSCESGVYVGEAEDSNRE